MSLRRFSLPVKPSDDDEACCDEGTDLGGVGVHSISWEDGGNKELADQSRLIDPRPDWALDLDIVVAEKREGHGQVTRVNETRQQE